MNEDPTHTHWRGARLVSRDLRGIGRPRSPWVWLLSVVTLIVCADWLLGLGAAQGPAGPADAATTASPTTSADLRAVLSDAADEAASGRRTLLLVGDSVLAGDVMAASTPDWHSQRVVDHMRAELGRERDASIHQLALDGLLPVDAAHVLAELDRLDPGAKVELVLEINLRYFSKRYAEQRECSRPQLCELGPRSLLSRPSKAARARDLLTTVARLGRAAIAERTPVRRRSRALRELDLGTVEGLVTDAEPGHGAPESRDIEGLARVSEHYRSASLSGHSSQKKALELILDRLRTTGRPATLFLTPLEDRFAATTLGDRRGRVYERLAYIVHQRGLARGAPGIDLLDLDHPVFGSQHFLDHVHLGPEGNRILAINLLHELGLPLARRPLEPLMIHGEDHDRSLVHRSARGFAEGGAWDTLLDRPNGVAVSRDGSWIVIADTDNHMLRQLRGNMQIVERLAGKPGEPGDRDGPGRSQARLQAPHSPAILGDEVYLIDGRRRARVRRLADNRLTTLEWAGPRCGAHDELEARSIDGRASLVLLCRDARIIAVDLARGQSELLVDPKTLAPELTDITALATSDDSRLLFADDEARIWSLTLDERERGELPSLVFSNRAKQFLPQEFKRTYPFRFDEMALNRVVEMQWVERYHGLLVLDAHDLNVPSKRLQSEETERVHLRFMDLDGRRFLPWVKPIVHGEAFHMWNETTNNLVSYWHAGSMALAQDDASLVWVERERSRVFRIADGLLGAAKYGNLHTTWSKVELLQPLGTGSSTWISRTMRPDRFLAYRHEPLPRAGPYVALLIGSSFTTISDRFGNYSLGRRLELELQRALGYHDGLRLDLYQRVRSMSSLVRNTEQLHSFLTAAGPPPDVVFFELHQFQDAYFSKATSREDQLAELARIQALADRYDTLVLLFDNTGLEAYRRDGLRARSPELERFIADAKQLGFVVLEPTDLMLRELLRESPWSNQSWGDGQHHGSPWAIDLTARALATMSYPIIRAHLRGRAPARLSERDPDSFEDTRSDHPPLSAALAATQGMIDPSALPEVRPAHVQRRYHHRALELYVDLAGVEAGSHEAIALSVLYAALVDDAQAQVAERVEIELVEFSSYDEYGEGALSSAEVVWRRSLDHESLERLIVEFSERQTRDD